MENQFLFIEEGSVDTLNLRKFLDGSELSETNIIRYKKGAPKPELVSLVKHDDAAVDKIIIDSKKEQTDELLKKLEQFIGEYAEFNKFFDAQRNAGRCIMKYEGTPETFIGQFKVFLDKDDITW